MKHFMAYSNNIDLLKIKLLLLDNNKKHITGTRCLGSDELVYKKHFVTVCYKMHMVGKMF